MAMLANALAMQADVGGRLVVANTDLEGQIQLRSALHAR